MKRFFVLSLLALMVFACENPSTLVPPEASAKAQGKISKIKPQETPHDFMFMQRAYPSGEIRTEAYAEAIAWKREQLQRSSSNILWEFIGPTNIGGRITDIEIPIDQAQTYFVGSASGGIFKTTDAGANWTPIFDDQEMLSIGDIEISKNDTDILWVGTGEVNAGGGSLAYDGDGIYRSADGGITWEIKGLPDVGSIGKIVIDPNDDNTLFVGAMGPLFRDDTNRGVYRSTDGGDTWDQVLFVSPITGVIDMAIHPSNGDIVYAASWERIRRPEMRLYGGATSGLHRSLDGGDTWNEMTTGLPGNPSEKGRISIDISLSNPNVLYARYADANGSIQGVYRTANGGDTWTEMNSSQLTNIGFHWWFRGIFVDPTDEDIIYNVDFVVQKSTNGGASWSGTFPNVHVDQHAMAFNASVAGEVLLGNDGGFYKSTNNGSSSVKDNTLPITQFYRFYVDPQNGDKIYGGTQDNNTIRTTTGGSSDWSAIFGGDGFQPLVDADNTNVIYALSQRGNLGKSTNNGASFSSALNGIPGADRNNWDTPIAFDPNDSQTLYYGTQRLFKTTNAAGNWTAISPDLTNGSGGGNLTFGTIISISVSPFDSQRIYVGTDDGNVWVTPDGGTIWNNVSSGLPDRWVTSVYASPIDTDVVYITLSGYRYGEDSGHVYMSENAGTSWVDIGTGLPDIPVNDIIMDRFANLYLATDIGVLASLDDGTTWEVLGDNMPAVVVTDMHIHESDELLYAATYGRSVYKLDLSSNPLSTETSVIVEDISVYPNPATDHVNIVLSDSAENVSVELYDTMGRIVIDKVTSEENRIKINISGIASGVYYLKIYVAKRSVVKKLIIK
ncbi:MAG: T9SS type A sorting domain-containing protein [Bacteroidetes bacterium]|nr:T9SS type A sorting domain-containing protein [Bacteroidota bacterium]